MHGGRSSDTSVSKLFKEGHAESPNDFISLKLIIVEAGKKLYGYVSSFTPSQKIQNKNKLCVYFKRRLFVFKVKEFSFYF